MSDVLKALLTYGKPAGSGPLAPIDASGFASKVAPGGTIAGSVAGNPMSLMDRLFGDADGGGMALPAIGAASGLMNGWLGMKQFGLAEDQFDFQKQAFNKNFEAQRKMTNASLADRQNARNAANPNHQDTASYMKQWGVK